MLTLDSQISNLRMVGPAYLNRLKKLEITTIKDLLLHPPHRYNDFSTIKLISKLKAEEIATIQGTISASRNLYTKSRKIIQKATIKDDSGQIDLTWFNQPFIANTLKAGETVNISGKTQINRNRLVMVSPEYEVLKTSTGPDFLKTIHTGRLVPIYPETEGLSSKWLRSRIAPLINTFVLSIKDWLPEATLEELELLPIQKALRYLHFPNNLQQAKRAKKRLAFDEMFFIQLNTLLRKQKWQQTKLAKPLNINQARISQFVNDLPFKLTKAQNRVTKELLSDLSKDKPMNRLLQGDVGSGKTVVSAIAIYASCLNKLPSALMAPTEILTNQHLKTISTLFRPHGIKIAVATSSQKKGVENYDVIIGTHALLYNRIKANDFGLVVIDEQHRFGVEQRAKLIKKAKSPHLLTMTATPIPRTVALTVYGDLDLSLLDEMPPGRIPTKTWVVPPRKRESAYNWIKHQIKRGEQAFIVCPLIEPSQHESLQQVKAASEECQRLKTKVFPNLALALLHGRLKSKEKDKVLQSFRKNKTQILVSTAVIEVGIDIPNATIMMIEAAERFGLAQLHQLRGRVGRGSQQSYCLLFTSSNISSNTKRLKAMETANSGQQLANLDLKIRGPGEIFGTRQHGFTNLKFASFSDLKLIELTRKLADSLLKKDPKLTKHLLLKHQLLSLEKAVEPN